jgi:hypothetical protein
MRSVSAGFCLLMISFGAQFREPHTALGQVSHGDRRSPACRSDVTPRRFDCFKPVPRHSNMVSNATDKIERMSGRLADRLELHGYQSIYRFVFRRPKVPAGGVGFGYHKPVLPILIVYSEGFTDEVRQHG